MFGNKDVKAMPATPRPRGFTGASASSSRPSTNTPMSERQQMALLMQMTSSSNQSDMTGHSPARSRDRNERGETALHVAAIKGEQDAVKKLLDQGMNPNVTDFAGWSPLHEACNHGHYNVALILIKAGANINAKGLDDNTPLHDAATVGHLKLVKMLVEKGADPTIKNRKGKTACDVAVASVYSYLQQAKESSNNRTSQQIKKGGGGTIGGGGSNTDAKTKPTIEDNNEDATCNSTSNNSSSGSVSNNNNSNTANQSNVGGSNAGSSGSNQNINSTNLNLKEDEDIYEFKTTPKDLIGTNDDKTDCLVSGNSNSSSASANVQVNPTSANNSNNSSSNTPNSGVTSGTSINVKHLDKNSPDEKTGSDDLVGSSGGGVNVLGVNSSTNQSKRSHSDIESTEETTFNVTDDENKRKKRKETETVKESAKTASGSRNLQSARQDKTTKVIGAATKAIALAGGKSGQIDRKSPCASPKPASKSTDSDAELENDSKNENFASSGPKVPPLKIVIPPQNTTGDQDVCIRNGKNASARNHPALPYVVASSTSGNNDINVEKENSTSRCTSPSETNTKSIDNEKQTKLNANSSAEERAQQRVLRSSHRSGGASGQSVDRGSNNSSPQLQSSSPSPAPPTSTGSNSSGNQCVTNSTSTSENATNLNNAQQSSSSNTSSPIAQPQHNADSDSSVRNAPSPVASSTTSAPVSQNTVELHPRKRKIRTSKEDTKSSQAQSNTSTTSSSNDSEKESILKDEIPSHDQPMTNCYQMFLNIRKQIERRQRNLFPVQPKPPQGFKDYLMNRGTYVLSGKTSEPVLNYPLNLPQPMKELYSVQEKERHKLKMQHVVEKEKLVLAVEQEILRVHGRAARALANQSLPFSVCTILKDEEVYNMITPEQEEKDRNARSRYNGRLFLSWLQDVDDKWEKIKEAMLFRHHNEVESLHAVQKMDWEWKMKELLLCEYKAKPVIEELHVPIVHVSDDFDLLPA